MARDPSFQKRGLGPTPGQSDSLGIFREPPMGFGVRVLQFMEGKEGLTGEVALSSLTVVSSPISTVGGHPVFVR